MEDAGDQADYGDEDEEDEDEDEETKNELAVPVERVSKRVVSIAAISAEKDALSLATKTTADV